MTGKQKYLVCYDYGTGGLWGLITAPSRGAITDLYPELVIVEERPEFLRSEDAWQRLVHKNSYDLDDEPTGLLLVLVRARNRPS